MTFARFMELALYEPGHGYYRRPAAGPGRDGDFLTAPSCIRSSARRVARLPNRRGTPSTARPVRRRGARGGHRRARPAILDGLRVDGSPLAGAIRYRPIDIEAARLGPHQGAARCRRRRPIDGHGRRHRPGPHPRQRGPRRAAGPPGRHARPPRRALRHDHRRGSPRSTERRPRRGPPGASRGRRRDPGPRPGRGDLACRRGMAGGRDATASAGRGRRSSTTAPKGATSTAPLARRAASDVRPSHRRRRPVDPGRPPGPDDPRVPHRRAARGGRGRAGPIAETTQAELLVGSGAGDIVARSLSGPDASLERALELRSSLARLLDPRMLGGYHVLGVRSPPARRLRAPGAGAGQTSLDRIGHPPESTRPPAGTQSAAWSLGGSTAGGRDVIQVRALGAFRPPPSLGKARVRVTSRMHRRQRRRGPLLSPRRRSRPPHGPFPSPARRSSAARLPDPASTLAPRSRWRAPRGPGC